MTNTCQHEKNPKIVTIFTQTNRLSLFITIIIIIIIIIFFDCDDDANDYHCDFDCDFVNGNDAENENRNVHVRNANGGDDASLFLCASPRQTQI